MLSHAYQQGNNVHIINENGIQSAHIPVSTLPGSGLLNYTSKTVIIRQGNTIQTYNEHGVLINTVFARDSVKTTKSFNDSGKSQSFKWYLMRLFWAIVFVIFLVYVM